MDIYKALADFSPQEKKGQVLSFKKGDLFEILEFQVDRAEKDWWAAKSVKNGEVGYVPGKFFMLDSIQKGPLSVESQKERDKQVEELETMQKQEEPLPDLYKLPPLEIQPYDLEDRQESNAESGEDPSPDYSDSEDENDENDNTDKSQIKTKLESKLSLEEWERIKQKAGEVDTPDPDYEDPPNGSANGYAHQGSSTADGNTEGIIAPKKLQNPVLESKLHQNLHRELMMSQKRGESVLNKKSELQKELERRKTAVKKKEYAEYLESKKTDIEKKLDEQAEKMKKYEIQDPKKKDSKAENQSEFQRVHSKINKNPFS